MNDAPGARAPEPIEEMIAGLFDEPKHLQPKFLYDKQGARLFHAICESPEYYLNRAERDLLGAIAPELARLVGSGSVVIEPGSGSAEKVELLLEPLRPSAYLPIEFAMEQLAESVQRFSRRHPALPLYPLCADFTRLGNLPGVPPGRRLLFFPGSTIGNFEPAAAEGFLRRLAALARPGGGLLIGVDLKKERAILEAAYNDAGGVTAAFNKNLLARLNRECGAAFALSAFTHHAFYDAEAGRVEMHLMSRVEQRVAVAGETIHLRAGETIHTENSYKYTVEEFRALAWRAGWSPVRAWADSGRLFSIHYFVAGEPSNP